MSDQTVLTPRSHPNASSEVRGAWWCVASIPAALVAGYVGAEAVAAALGHTDAGVPPWWVGGLALLTASLAMAVPTAVAWRLHRRARARGDDRAAVPAYALLVVTAGVLLLNLFSWLMRVLLE